MRGKLAKRLRKEAVFKMGLNRDKKEVIPTDSGLHIATNYEFHLYKKLKKEHRKGNN